MHIPRNIVRNTLNYMFDFYLFGHILLLQKDLSKIDASKVAGMGQVWK